MELARMRGTFFTSWGLWCTAGGFFHKLKLAVGDGLGLVVGDGMAFFHGLGLVVGDRGWVGVSQALACENKKYH